jgi:hypothetical protein
LRGILFSGSLWVEALLWSRDCGLGFETVSRSEKGGIGLGLGPISLGLGTPGLGFGLGPIGLGLGLVCCQLATNPPKIVVI